MPKNYTLKGKIVSGARQAAFFTQLDWVQKQCREKFGFTPYPGTLNLEIAKEYLHVIETLQKEKLIELIPPDPNFCTAKTITAQTASIQGAVIIPEEDVNIHAKNIIEIIAPIMIKKALGVKDGDTLEFKLIVPDS